MVESEQLKHYMWILKEWDASNNLPDEVLLVFQGLEELDQSKNEDLWQELDQVITGNKDFAWEPFLKYIEPFKGDQRWWQAMKNHEKSGGS